MLFSCVGPRHYDLELLLSDGENTTQIILDITIIGTMQQFHLFLVVQPCHSCVHCVFRSADINEPAIFTPGGDRVDVAVRAVPGTWPADVYHIM
jgi:hypothetical protein